MDLDYLDVAPSEAVDERDLPPALDSECQEMSFELMITERSSDTDDSAQSFQDARYLCSRTSGSCILLASHCFRSWRRECAVESPGSV